MACCSRAAPLLLVHVNLLLFLYAGAGLVTAARLKWDPSLYVAVRELFPLEYRVSAAALCAASAVLLALGHLCAAGLAARGARLRRALLTTYAVVMVVLMAFEAAWGAWTGFRVAEFLRSERAKQMAEGASLFDEFKKFLENVSWMWLFNKIKLLIKEAEEDALTSARVAAVSAIVFFVLQPLAALLAFIGALGGDRASKRRRLSHSWATTTTTASAERLTERDPERAPLRTAYKNGRIVVL